MARKILRPAKKPNFLIRDRDRLQQKREAVAEAAFELFLKEGFHRTTTRDIAQRAGVSAGAPFTYFKDKENILFHIVSKEQDRAGDQLLSALSQQIAEATHTGADPEPFASCQHQLQSCVLRRSPPRICLHQRKPHRRRCLQPLPPIIEGLLGEPLLRAKLLNRYAALPLRRDPRAPILAS